MPNRAARALVTQRTDSVALVVSESEERVFAEPFFAGDHPRHQRRADRDAACSCWLAMAQSPAERERVEHYLTGQHVDGVLLRLAARRRPAAGPAGGARAADRARRPAAGRGSRWPTSTPTTAAGPGRPSRTCSASGRRRIAAIAGPQDMGVGLDRLAGYRDAAGRGRAAADDSLVEYGDFSRGRAAPAAMRSCWTADPDLDAVFAASDLMAVGAMRALRERPAGARATSRWSASRTRRRPRTPTRR